MSLMFRVGQMRHKPQSTGPDRVGGGSSAPTRPARAGAA